MVDMSNAENSRVVVIIPTYNEIETLPSLLEEIKLRLPEVEVLIVDDSSPDGTGRWVEEESKNKSWLHLISRRGKLGLGTAYVTGFKWALKNRFDIVVQMDGDGSHDPKYLPELLSGLKEADLIIGSRWVKGGGTENWPLKRRLISRLGSLYATTILGVNVKDITSGFKAIKREVLEALDLDSIEAEGFAFQLEFTYEAIKKGFKVKELPIVFRDRERGVSKFSFSIFREALFMVPKLKVKSIFFK